MRENEGPERRRRDYAAWLCADTSWQVGSGVGTFALMMVALDLTGSSVKAGWVATTAGAVAALMALPGGAIVDRRDRRWCLTVAGLARAGLYGVVLLLLATGHVTLGALVLCGGLAGLITGLFGTASDAALPDVVGREDVPRAVTLNRGRDGVVSLLNEPLSGALLGAASWLPFAVTVLGAVGQVLGIRLVRADLSAQHEAEAEKDAGRDAVGSPLDVATGSVDARHDAHAAHEAHEVHWLALVRLLLRPVPLALLGASLVLNMQVAVLLYGIQMSQRLAGSSALSVGVLNAAMAAGVLLGALPASWLLRRVPGGTILLVGSVLSAVAVVPALVAPGRMGFMAAFVLVGLPAAAMDGIALGYVQHMTPRDGQGRMLALLALAVTGVAAAAPLLAGVLVELGRARLCLLAAEVLALMATVAILAVGGLRRLGRVSEWTPSA